MPADKIVTAIMDILVKALSENFGTLERDFDLAKLNLGSRQYKPKQWQLIEYQLPGGDKSQYFAVQVFDYGIGPPSH